MNLKEVPGQRGNPLLLLNNFKYYKMKRLATGELKWHCVKKNCPSIVLTIRKNSCREVSKSPTEHNHTAEDYRIVGKRKNVAAKKKASENVSEPPGKIGHSIVNNLEEDILEDDSRKIYPTLPNPAEEALTALENIQAGEPDIASSTLELLPEQTEQPDLRPRPFKGSKDNRIYCRLCLKPAYKNSLTPLSVVDFNYPGKSETFRKKKLEKVEEINKMLKFCLPFYDSLTFNPVICSICLGRLKVCYEFSKECLKSQRLIEKYADTYSATERVINLSEMIETKFRLPDDENMSDIETDVFDIPKVTSSSGNISQKRQYSNEDRPPAKRRKDYHESHEEDSQSSSNEDTSNIKIEPDDDDSCALKMEPSDDDFTEDVPHDVLKSYIIDPNKIDETTMIKVEPNYIDSSDFIKNEPLDDLHVKNKVYTGRTDIGTDIEKQSSHLQEMKNVPLVTTKVPPSLPVGPVFPKVESSLEDTTSDVIK